MCYLFAFKLSGFYEKVKLYCSNVKSLSAFHGVVISAAASALSSLITQASYSEFAPVPTSDADVPAAARRV